MTKHHFLVVAFPAQGHINPALYFAKRLASHGALVTLATTVHGSRRISKGASLPQGGLSFVSFSDGFDDGFKFTHDDDTLRYLEELQRRGTESLTQLVRTRGGPGGNEVPFTCLVYTPLLSWATKVAAEFHLPAALLWVQPALVFDIFYYYYNGHRDEITDERHESIELPGLPPLESRDIPSFITPSNPYAWAQPAFRAQFQTLGEEHNPRILINSFDALEPEALTAIPRLKMLAVGPLLPSGILDSKASKDVLLKADLSHGSEDYRNWLDSKPEGSVAYVSFGTIAVLSKPQMEEIARALLQTKRPFLWVITKKIGEGEEREEDKLVDYREDLKKQGLLLSWCSQVEVLSHPSVGCFLTHCGWNSTLESLACGVPTVAFPLWADQGTNAKMIETVWMTGVRVVVNEEGMVESAEVKRCLELVMGETAEEFRKNARRWRDLALEATQDGGSSHRNLQAFMQEVRERKM